jgi:hypothetical protein
MATSIDAVIRRAAWRACISANAPRRTRGSIPPTHLVEIHFQPAESIRFFHSTVAHERQVDTALELP